MTPDKFTKRYPLRLLTLADRAMYVVCDGVLQVYDSRKTMRDLRLRAFYETIDGRATSVYPTRVVMDKVQTLRSLTRILVYCFGTADYLTVLRAWDITTLVPDEPVVSLDDVRRQRQAQKLAVAR